MAIQVIRRNIELPSLRKTRLRELLVARNVPGTIFYGRPLLEVRTRCNFITKTGGRRKALTLGLLFAKKLAAKNVLLYRKPQPNPTQFYPIFTPWRRRVKALGNKVAPVIAVGGGGTGMNLQHYLGLSLLQLGGMIY